MTEHEQGILNPFGEALADLMAERWIESVPELVERMRQHPSWIEEYDVAYVDNLMTMSDPREYPEDDVDMLFFYVLKQEEVLNLSTREEVTRLLEPFDSVFESIFHGGAGRPEEGKRTRTRGGTSDGT